MEKEKLDELYEKGLLVDPNDISGYLKNFEKSPKKSKINESFWKNKRVLITGISGFAGSHLAEKLIALDANILGLVRRQSVPEYPNLTKIMEKVELFEGNLTDGSSLLSMIKKFEPEVIFHLAAQSFVPTSFRCPIETYDTNVVGTANLIEAVRQSDVDVKAIQFACSSEEYGLVYPNEVPIKETNPLRPQSPYAASKVAAEKIAEVNFRSYGMPCIITRTFNHTGPRRGLQFVTSVVARQVAKIKAGLTNKIIIGNQEPIRDFTDVRDIVEGYLLAVEKGKKGEPYNLGHGIGISIGNLIRLAAKLVEIEDYKIIIDKNRFRPAEVDILICDYSKSNKDFGYAPRIPLTKALKDNIEYFQNNPNLLRMERH